ncbi:uncharacterized protein LOC103483882 isoform X2 [Cucumis melo]|uniref:Uncharacterized protein LOC103483882 isoform X2 n=1 Tax=Cucumis melo TaxID=3656 RepID=A0A1S3AX63_CUCME|nr:uncharacterized protein LOC103483882 isoform X2 [Cucumis melo]
MEEFNGGYGDNFCSPPDQHEMPKGKKYGGLVPRKKPLISKDNERAFFDSADWALCKQGAPGGYQKTMAMVETLRPKLQRTQRQQLPHGDQLALLDKTTLYRKIDSLL